MKILFMMNGGIVVKWIWYWNVNWAFHIFLVSSLSLSTKVSSTSPLLMSTLVVIFILFAKDNLISLKIHYQQYWIETHYTYYVKSMHDLVGEVSVTLAVYFGISLITLAELIFFMFQCCNGGRRVHKGEVKRISNPNPPPPPQNPTLMNNYGIQARQPVSTVTVQY